MMSDAGALPDPVADRRFYEGVPAKRLIAFLIDWALIWGVAIGVSILTLGIGFLIFGPIAAVADFIYRVLTVSNRSATLGMRAMGVELRAGDGRRFTFGQAVGHTILFYFSLYLVFIHLVSIIMMAGSSTGRGLHDIPFGSTVINSPE